MSRVIGFDLLLEGRERPATTQVVLLCARFHKSPENAKIKSLVPSLRRPQYLPLACCAHREHAMRDELSNELIEALALHCD